MRFVLVLCALLSLVNLCHAAVVTTLDTVGRLLICPDQPTPCNVAQFTVTVTLLGGAPDVGAPVVLVFNPICVGPSRIALCTSAVVSRLTDAAGRATFNVAGGGCCKDLGAVQIWVRGLLERSFNVIMSPDYAMSDNVGLSGFWNYTVGLPDFAAFAAAYASGLGSCHDYDNNGSTGLTDFVVFAACFGRHC